MFVQAINLHSHAHVQKPGKVWPHTLETIPAFYGSFGETSFSGFSEARTIRRGTPDVSSRVRSTRNTIGLANSFMPMACEAFSSGFPSGGAETAAGRKEQQQ